MNFIFETAQYMMTKPYSKFYQINEILYYYIQSLTRLMFDLNFYCEKLEAPIGYFGF
jgi:hypothetical protein